MCFCIPLARTPCILQPCFLQEDSPTWLKVHNAVSILRWSIYCYRLILDTKKEYRKIAYVFLINHHGVIYIEQFRRHYVARTLHVGRETVRSACCICCSGTVLTVSLTLPSRVKF